MIHLQSRSVRTHSNRPAHDSYAPPACSSPPSVGTLRRGSAPPMWSERAAGAPRPAGSGSSEAEEETWVPLGGGKTCQAAGRGAWLRGASRLRSGRKLSGGCSRWRGWSSGVEAVWTALQFVAWIVRFCLVLLMNLLLYTSNDILVLLSHNICTNERFI